MNEESIIKPTFRKPVSDQAKKFDKNFNRTMNINGVNLTEVDGLLTEKEQSLKKKIFSLAKMEALVFSDPKLTSVYNEMAENGEEKYGYHYNETIQNMIFNDYVLNSPKYLQKYKMAIPKEKKRRDKSGINQLKKTMHSTDMNKQKVVEENDESITKVWFLINDVNSDLFAYFPDIIEHGEYRMGYSHIGQHSAVHPDYADESRIAKPEEYQDLKNELEGIGYNLEVLNSTNETTGAASSGSFAPAMGFNKQVDETTTSASSGAYVSPAAWGGGDLMKGGKGKAMRKPIWKGGTIIQESEYLTDPSGFEKYVNELNEQSDAEYVLNNSNAYGKVNNMNPENQKIIKNDIQSGKLDTPNLNVNEDISPDMYSTKEDLKHLIQTLKQRTGKGLTKDHIPMLAGEALYTIAIQLANRLLPLSWDDLPDTNSMWDYIDENGNMSYDKLVKAVKQAVNDRLSEEGMSLDMLSEKAKSKSQQRFMGMVHAVQKGELSPNKVGGSVANAAKSMSDSDVEDFASTKHKGLPEKKVDENPLAALAVPAATGFGQAIGNRVADKVLNELSLYDAVEYVSDRNGEEPFMLGGNKWQFVNAKYPNGKIDIGVYRFGHDVVYDYEKWREAMNINETESSMISDNPTSMSNKNNPAGTVSNGNVETGMHDMNESMNLLEELNNELDAYSIHHNKLKRMAEDRKPSALVLKDRLGAENKTNFKKDMQQSGTKDVIDVEKELMWKDQQTDVGDNPQKLGKDIEKKAIQTTKGAALKNVGNSTNDKGDEAPKRNLTTEEQDEVNMYRLGLGDYVYDNKPDKRFEDRMKADMGDNLYQQRQEKLKFRAKAPMYNKDTQPIEDGSDKVQFNKEETGWNEREGLKETMITGRYHDILNKRKLIEFTLNEVKLIENVADLFELDFTGLGNSYLQKTENYKVKVNETVAKAINSHKFYTDGTSVFAVKNAIKNINENDEKLKPVVNEQVDKMKHLLGYKPNNFVDTNNVKKNRGF